MNASPRLANLFRNLVFAVTVTAGAFAQTMSWSGPSIVAPAADSYDFTVAGPTAYVAYSTGGNVYVTTSSGGGAWAAPTLVAAGSAPSVAIGPDGLNVGYISGSGTVAVSTYAGSWNTTDLGNVNGSSRVMLRTDGLGTMYLLNEGSGTGGRGSLDLASNSGGGWTPFANLAYGWYDSGSGNYFHQGILATRTDGGYVFAYEQDNWGGRASWSDKFVGTSGFSSSPNHGYGWNSGSAMSNGALSLCSSGHGAWSYVIDGTGYVNFFDGSGWTGEISVGSASSISIAGGGAETFGVFSSGGNLYQFISGASPTALTLNAAPLAGTSPLLIGTQFDSAGMLYLDGIGQLNFVTAIPESSACAAVAGLGALALALWRRRAG